MKDFIGPVNPEGIHENRRAPLGRRKDLMESSGDVLIEILVIEVTETPGPGFVLGLHPGFYHEPTSNTQLRH